MFPCKKTKIICSISDINCEPEFIGSLFENGMNIVRINSAHATIEGAQKIVGNVRSVSEKIPILIDTKGPEVRLTECEKPFIVHTGAELFLNDDTTKRCEPGNLHTTYPHISRDIPVGKHILIDDGSVDLEVVEVLEGRLKCIVKNDGKIGSKKSVNVPGVHINLPALTEKDKKFLDWAVGAGIDFVAHSFVRNASDLAEIQAFLDERGSQIKIISKIENQQGVDNIDEILRNCYGVMVARGDLGVEIPAERIPLIQQELVKKCQQFRKPVIVATQMLQSMIENPRPTRAEVTDVANAIFQGADAIMLSGESAFGHYPVEAVQTMTRIAQENEGSVGVNLNLDKEKVMRPVAAQLARSLVASTLELPIKALVFDTFSGRVGRYLSSFRPGVPMYAMCYNLNTFRELTLVRGIEPIMFSKTESKEEFAHKAIDMLLDSGDIQEGDLIGFIGGVFGAQVGATYLEFTYAVHGGIQGMCL